MKILFHTNQLSLRGTEVALFDYARYNEEILGNESIIVSNMHNTMEALPKFQSRFKVEIYKNPHEIDAICSRNDADIFYAIKAGFIDGVVSGTCKTVIHVVFKEFQPHGDVYAYISKWLTDTFTQGQFPYVPHIVTLPSYNTDLRKYLNIPNNARVFGLHGGSDTFDIQFVHKAVHDVAMLNNKIYFIFMNIPPFCDHLPNVIHLQGTYDMLLKAAFINTCDAMLHARNRGETFGLSVAEFSIRNKPVFTWSGSSERNHIEILGSDGVYYENYSDLKDKLIHFQIDKSKLWDKYSNLFSPDKVMMKFKEVFIGT
jgi:hypothetical protein